MLKDRPEIEEDLIVLLENDKIPLYTETLSFRVEDLLRRIPTLMDGPVCPNETDCRCTYEGGCQALKVGIGFASQVEDDTTDKVMITGPYKILDLD